MARTRDEVAKDCQLAERIYMSAKDKALYAEAFEKECLGHLISLENELEEIDTEAGAFDDMDGDFDSGMASAGFGTDEDYNYFPMGDE